MLRYPPFNVQVVGMEKKRCRGQASNNQAWWVERIAGNKRKRGYMPLGLARATWG